jgi:hypothetical protein
MCRLTVGGLALLFDDSDRAFDPKPGCSRLSWLCMKHRGPEIEELWVS